MLALPESLESHLMTGTTTLCHCWKVTPRNLPALGFTDHDRALTFEGMTFEATAGLTASALESLEGMSVDNMDVWGALNSDHLSEVDLVSGHYDNAQIEVWKVNWQDPEARALIKSGNLGEVSQDTVGFRAEVRGRAHQLNQSVGRLYQYSCDAVLGDTRCGVDLNNPLYRRTVSVVEITGDRSLAVSGAEGIVENWFTHGAAQVQSGSQAGRHLTIKSHVKTESGDAISFWDLLGEDVSVGDQIDLTAGCNRLFATCRDKFSNAASYRGFPHMPGNDYVVSYPSASGNHQGGSLNGN